MEWIYAEAIRCFSPAFTDVFVVREALQRLEAFGIVVSCEEGLQMLPELVVSVVVIAPDGGVLQETLKWAPQGLADTHKSSSTLIFLPS
jgi:hypothetical protein